MRVWWVVSRALAPLAVRHLTTHVRAASVAVFALACGVATSLATQVLYDSVLAAHADTTARFVGRAAFQVGNGDAGVGEEVVEDLRRVPGVRAAAPSVEGFVTLPDLPGERLYLYGVDLLADQDVRDYGAGGDAAVSDPLAFLAEPDSVALSRAFTAAHRLRAGDRVRILTPNGVAALTVRAFLGEQHGVASVLDGRIAVVDLSVAQDLLRMEGRVSQVAVALEPEADAAVVQAAIAARLGRRGTVEEPRARTAAFVRLLANYRYGLLVTGAIAVIVGLFVVFNIATIAVVDRRRELGVLRTVGCRARHLVGLVVLEIVGLAALSALAGLPLGVALARFLRDSFATTTTALYGEVAGAALRVSSSAVAGSLVVALVAPLLAVVGPMRTVLGSSPLDALRTAAYEPPRAARFALPAAAGAAMLLAATVL
jgi:putative ABC transport system permease protein